MILNVVGKLGCSKIIAKIVIQYFLGNLTGPAGWTLLAIDVGTTVAGAVLGGAGAFVKKAAQMGLKAAIKRLVAREGMAVAIRF